MEARLDSLREEPGTIALRPLSIGEMLDRAVSLSVRSFVILFLIYVAYSIPQTVFQYFGTADMAKYLSSIADVLQKSGTTPDPQTIARALNVAPVFNAFTVLYFVTTLLVGPLPTAALMWSATEIYVHDRVPTFAGAYREALRCWVPLLVVTLLWIALGLLAYVAFAFFVLIVVFAFALLAFAFKTVGLVLGIVVVSVLVAAFLVLVLVGVLAVYGSYLAIIVERSGPIAALSSGLARVVGRSFRKSVLVSLALSAVGIGVFLMGALGQGLLYVVAHNNALATTFSALLRLVVVVFTAVFVTIYYFDIRIRTEGLDLRMAESPGTALDVPAV
jgi:hypothetical protein